MGVSSSSFSDASSLASCTIKNRMGVEARAICWCASDGSIPDLPSVVFRDAIPHGAEQSIQADKSDCAGLSVAIQMDGRLPFVVLVPNAATLLLRHYGGQGIARFCRQGAEMWEVPEIVDATQVLNALGSARAAAASQQAELCPQVQQAISTEAEDIGVVAQPDVPSLAPDRVTAASSAAEATALGVIGAPIAVQRSQTDVELRRASAEKALSDGEVAPALRPECICPISHAVFVDPVLAADGFTYERECIEEWWRRRGPLSPMTGRQVASTELVPNLAIRSLCAEQVQRWDTQVEQKTSEIISFYDPHLPLLIEMFTHLDPDEIGAVCAGLWEEGILDIDICVRRLLERHGSGSEVAAVSLAPVCCPARSTQAEAATALLDPCLVIPQSWPVERELLFVELLEHQFPPVRARKALELGTADTFEEAVDWLERHQDDADIDVPMEILKERADHRLALTVMRVATVPAAHRLECLMALHKILGRIIADPESQRLRQFRRRNEKFHRQVGRFPPAVALLRAVGFKQGDFWVSASNWEPCLEFKLPIDSDNIASQRFVRAYSLLDQVLQEPDKWLSSVGEAQPEVAAAWVTAALPSEQTVVAEDSATAQSGEDFASRAFLADMHERRIRDPRGFQAAMLAAGRKPNQVIVKVQQPAHTTTEEQAARRLSGAVPSSSSTGSSASGAASDSHRRLDERFGGRRHFDLRDIETMRVEEAIAGRTFYANEYDTQQGTSNTYADLVTRSYDPQYLGRKAVDGTNTFRAQQQMPPLRWSQGLADIAAEHAGQMARGEMPFSHQGFDDRTRRYPFAYFSAAENLAYNSGVADAAGVAVDGWIKSPGHRKNLLGAFDLCGVGVARSAGGQFFFTQLFARSAGGALC